MLQQSQASAGRDSFGANYGILLIEFFQLYSRVFLIPRIRISINRPGIYQEVKPWIDGIRQPSLSIEDPLCPGWSHSFVLILTDILPPSLNSLWRRIPLICVEDCKIWLSWVAMAWDWLINGSSILGTFSQNIRPKIASDVVYDSLSNFWELCYLLIFWWTTHNTYVPRDIKQILG